VNSQTLLQEVLRVNAAMRAVLLLAIALLLLPLTSGCGNTKFEGSFLMTPSGTGAYEAGLLKDPTVISSLPDLGKLLIKSGVVTYSFSGWEPNMPFSIDFCDWPATAPDDCFNVEIGASTDPRGAASGSFQFLSPANLPSPESAGEFLGWFRFNGNDANGSPTILSSGFNPSFTGGIDYVASVFSDGSEPIRNGSVTVSNGAVHIEVNGATPNSTYEVWEAFSDQERDQIALLQTDFDGNGAVDSQSTQPRGLIVLIRQGASSNLLSGFALPQANEARTQ
jgi:hypothetical protein